MEEWKDRTGDVEQRLRAIRVDAQDSCAFWTARDGTFITMQQCRYCLYGQFHCDISEIDQMGLCKFKL